MPPPQPSKAKSKPSAARHARSSRHTTPSQAPSQTRPPSQAPSHSHSHSHSLPPSASAKSSATPDTSNGGGAPSIYVSIDAARLAATTPTAAYTGLLDAIPGSGGGVPDARALDALAERLRVLVARAEERAAVCGAGLAGILAQRRRKEEKAGVPSREQRDGEKLRQKGDEGYDGGLIVGGEEEGGVGADVEDSGTAGERMTGVKEERGESMLVDKVPPAEENEASRRKRKTKDDGWFWCSDSFLFLC